MIYIWYKPNNVVMTHLGTQWSFINVRISGERFRDHLSSFFVCYEKDFMDSLNNNNQADVIKAFYLTSRYLGELLSIDNPCVERIVNRIYPPELQLNKANTTNTEVSYLSNLHSFFCWWKCFI